MENKFENQTQIDDEKLPVERETLLEKMRRIKGPIGGVTLFLMLGVGLWTLSRHLRNYHADQEKAPGEASFTVGDAKVKMESWQEIDLKSTDSPIPPTSKYLREMIEQQMPIFDREKNGESMIADEVAFEQWLIMALNDPKVIAMIGEKENGQISAKQWVELAAAVTINSLQFDKESQANLESSDQNIVDAASAHLQETTDKMSADEMLAKKASATCRHYATCAREIFNVFKTQHPEILSNIYMTRASSYNISHSWNMVIEVTGPDSAEISFIDPSAGEWSWEKTFVKNQDFIQLLFNLKESGVIEPTTLYSLAREYLQKNPDQTKLENFLLSNEPDNAKERAEMTKIGEQYLSQFSADKKSPQMGEAMARVVQLYCDPENFSRSENWHDQATAVSIMSRNLGFGEIATPGTPEAFYDQKFEDRIVSGVPISEAMAQYEKDLKKVEEIRAWAIKHNKTGVWWQVTK